MNIFFVPAVNTLLCVSSSNYPKLLLMFFFNFKNFHDFTKQLSNSRATLRFIHLQRQYVAKLLTAYTRLSYSETVHSAAIFDLAKE